MEGTELRFLYELALKLHMPVGTMLESMTAIELNNWRTLFKVKAVEAEMRWNK